MKYSMPFIFIFLLLSSTLTTGNSQSNQPGFLLTVQGDTISGLIRVVKNTKNAELIHQFVVRQSDGSEQIWESKTVAEYALDQDPGTALWIRKHFYAKVWPHNGWRVFLNPEIAGRAQLFEVPDPEKPWEPTTANKIVFQKPEATDKVSYLSFPGTALIVRLEPENYEVVLKQLLKDCPELTAQIGRKKFKFKDLEPIVTFYNESCE